MDKKKIMLSHISTNSSNSVPLLNTTYGRKRWVEYGVHDKMPSRLLELYNQSGFHHSIIDSRVNLMLGDGIIQDPDVEVSQRTEEFIDNPNPDENLESLYNKLSYDFEIFSIAYIEVIYSNDRTEIAEINHIDASKIRWGKKVAGKLTHVYYSENFNKTTSEKILIPTLNPNIKVDHPRQILPIVRYTPSVDYYSLPSYYAGIKWIEIDYQISNFHEHNIKNGFVPTIYFGFPMGTPTEDERDIIEKQLKKKYGGTENSGGIITAYYDSGADNKVDVQVLDITDADKQYEWLLKATQQQILISHKVTNENIVGIATAGKLGSSDEMFEAYQLYYNTVIKHESANLINGLNKIFTLNGMNNIQIKRDEIIEKIKEEK